MSRGALPVALLLGVSALGVARVQPRLAAQVHEVKQRDDVYLLPPPVELRAMSLGYRAALADAIWAKLIVEYGTHWQEKRPFTDAPRYFDGILALEPTYPLVYKYADTLIVYRPPRGTEQDWYTAKGYLERGLRERPRDHEVCRSCVGTARCDGRTLRRVRSSLGGRGVCRGPRPHQVGGGVATAYELR